MLCEYDCMWHQSMPHSIIEPVEEPNVCTSDQPRNTLDWLKKYSTAAYPIKNSSC